MADRFHFNPETGRTGKCSAEVQCRFGQSADQHGATREDARANYEAQMTPELFSNTQTRASAASEPISWDRLVELKRSFRELTFENGSATHRWASDEARSAAIRSELELRGIDSSRIGSTELLRGSYYYSNYDGDRIDRVFSNRGDGERAGWGSSPLSRDQLERDASERIQSASLDSPEALELMASTLEREKSHSYPVPVKESARFTEQQLDDEATIFQIDHGYTVEEMLRTRNIGSKDLEDAELETDGWVTVKIPSGSEADFSVELARRELSKPRPTGRYSW